MSTLLDLKTYFENYATKHVELQHVTGDASKATFFCMNTEKNTEEFIRNNPMDLIMILLVPDKTLSSQADNYVFHKHVAYLVLQRCPDPNNEAIVAAQNRCEVICNDFLTVLIKDRHELIDSMQPDTVDITPIGPMGDMHYGYMTMFRLEDYFDQNVDPDRWLP